MRIANKKRFIVSISILIIMIVSIFNCVSANKTVEYQEYTVVQGDTLWNIASEHATGDIREYIYHLRKLNNLEDCSLQIGQDILIIK